MAKYIHFMLKDRANGKKYSELVQDGDELVIGRNPGSTRKRLEVRTCIPLLDSNLSRNHVVVAVINSRLFAYDTSTNGTYVNGRKINGEGVVLGNGDVLGLGLTEKDHYDFDVVVKQESDNIFSGLKGILSNAFEDSRVK
ncbi:FHA domain protein [uncultured archaeon]|nr:FHA domain protein [uncultured archaeon]